jgi:hypothetical protein
MKASGAGPIILAMLFGVMSCGGEASKAEPKTPADSTAAALGKAAGGIIGGIMKMAEKQEELDQSNPYRDLTDPCILVSRAEMEKYLGPLYGDPYRASGKTANPTGHVCVYRGASGRTITIEPEYNSGQMALKTMRMGGSIATQVLTDESGKADTLEGDWDDVYYQFGTLSALKGDVLVSVGIVGSRAGPAGAAEIADIALKRLPHPLNYDGAKAAEHAPGPLVQPRDPCSLVTKEEAAAILGPLVGPPKSSKSACSFPVKNPLGPLANGPMEVVLAVEWTDGFAALENAKSTTNTVMKQFDTASTVRTSCNGGSCTSEVKSVGEVIKQTDSEARTNKADRDAMEQMRKVMGALGASTNQGSMTLKTDTTSLQGPWDEAALLAGIGFMAVKKDVSMSMDLRLLGLDKAKALVTKAMGRI